MTTTPVLIARGLARVADLRRQGNYSLAFVMIENLRILLH